MPRHDDASIPHEAVLIRAVHPDWVREDNGAEVTSATLIDGQLEHLVLSLAKWAEKMVFSGTFCRSSLRCWNNLERQLSRFPSCEQAAYGYIGSQQNSKTTQRMSLFVLQMECPNQYAKRAGGLASSAVLIASPEQGQY